MTEVVRGAQPNAGQARRWNGASGWHWILHRERHLAQHKDLIADLFDAAEIAAGERVLDIGCGCGETSITAARAVACPSPEGITPNWSLHQEMQHAGRVIGLDLSAPMLNIARRLTAQSGMKNITFRRGDAQIYPLRQNSFDIAISSFGVMFFADPHEAFMNIRKTLPSGGRLTFLCWQDDSQNEMHSIPLRTFERYTPLPTPDVNCLFDSDYIENLLRKGGWDGVKIEDIRRSAWLGSDVNDVMGYIRSMPSTERLIAGIGDQKLAHRIMADIAEKFAELERSDGVWVRAAAWLVRAHRI